MGKQKQIDFSLLELGSQVGTQQQWEKKVVLPNNIGTADLMVPKETEIDLDIYAVAMKEGVSISISGQTLAVGECVRCLRPTERKLQIGGSRVYYYPEILNQILSDLGEDDEDEDIDESYQLDISGNIDLEPLLIDLIIPQFPYQVLCREDCEGLCDNCGTPWDELPVTHRHEIIDSRWSQLADFFTEHNDKDE